MRKSLLPIVLLILFSFNVGRARSEGLVENNEAAVRRFCFGMLGNREQAEEVAQETFFRIWKNRNNYQPSNRFRSFLYTIARNRYLSLLRRRQILAFVGLDSVPPISDESRGSDDHIEAEERNAILYACMARLPSKLRSACPSSRMTT